MIIYFGLELDQLVYPEQRRGGIWYFGPKGMLKFLETHLGLAGHPTNNEFLRIEQFRQAIQKHATFHENAFYLASFKADPLATAAALLERRDELMLSGWDFMPTEKTPIRLKTIAQIENIAQTSEDGLGLSMGFADRWRAIEKALIDQDIPLDKLYVNEPKHILPKHFAKAFHIIQEKYIPVEHIHFDVQIPNSDLGVFKNCITKKAEKHQAKADGSIIVLKSKRSHSLATFSAKLFEKNRDYEPICLIPEKNRTLDNALIQEGLPSLGILSESLARPSLQILKLVTAFLWKPIDPFKVMEFVSLTVKPLRDDLAFLIANEIARTPGIRGDRWRFRIKEYFDNLQIKSQDEDIDVQAVQKQYSFWFNRQRYDITKTVPIEDVIEIFEEIAKWAKKTYDDDKSDPQSLLMLSEQAKRIVELVETLPINERRLTNLELERIVRTIYEPTPVTFKQREVNHLPYVHHNSAFIEPFEKLFWWNFLDNEPPYFFAKWYQNEMKYLKTKHIELDTPKNENERLLWQRTRPILYANQQVIFCLPATVDGTTAHPHPLMGNLAACFENLEAITIDIDKNTNLEWLASLGFDLSENIELEHKSLGSPKPYLTVEQKEKLAKREKESYSSLDALLFYPYKWVFQYKLDLQKSSILSIVKDHTLMGNLAHKVFEKLFQTNNTEPVLEWNAPQIMSWVDSTANQLMEREGAVLLMYGREPDRAAFVNKLKFAACNLLDMIRENGWQIKATEKTLEGKFLDIEIKGIADLVLENEKGEQAVIDLKWRGTRRRYNLIRNMEDLQLVLYSRLLTTGDDWAHTAFFIMEQGKMIARNNLAFKEAVAVAPEADHIAINKEIWQKMTETYQWRLSQLNEGKIEIRTEQTLLDLEDAMTADELMKLLEMKSKNAPFDDFKTLIGLLE